MARHGSPHDALFRRVFEDPAAAAALLRVVLPAPMTRQFDWSSLTVLPARSVDGKLAVREGDLLFRVLVDDGEVLLYIVLEHQHGQCLPMPRRLLRYTVRTWDRFVDGESERLPWVIPIVIYQGKSPWGAPLDLRAMLQLPGETRGLPVPSFPYLVDELRLWTPDELLRRAMPAYATLALWALRTATDRSFARNIRLLGHLADELVATASGREAFESILSYLSKTTRDDLVVLTTVVNELPQPSREVAMSAYDRLIEIGREQGLEQGLEQGIHRGIDRGMAGLVGRQIELKLGELPEWARERLAAADRAELERLGERVLVATSFEALFDEGA
ncbi:MAG: Rpn family recombination-promoting nuclease/putative transposase [Sandaracinaceae bacterium]